MGRWRDRIVLHIPPWVLVTLAVVTWCGAMYGWALSAFSVMDLVFDGARWAFEAIGLGDRLGRIVGGILKLVLVSLVGFPWVPAMASLADRPGETVADARYRGLRMLMVVWATFIIQVWVVPWSLSDWARVQVCTPVRDEFSGFELSFFAFGLIEGQVWLLVVMWELVRVRVPAVPGRRLTRAEARVATFFKFMWRGALAVQVLIVGAVPAAVRWWMPVQVCPDCGPSGGCKCVSGLEIGLCEYPTELVLAVYGNIVLSLAMRLWDSWKGGWNSRRPIFTERRSKMEGG